VGDTLGMSSVADKLEQPDSFGLGGIEEDSSVAGTGSSGSADSPVQDRVGEPADGSAAVRSFEVSTMELGGNWEVAAPDSLGWENRKAEHIQVSMLVGVVHTDSDTDSIQKALGVEQDPYNQAEEGTS
jgi:hypothetical protein